MKLKQEVYCDCFRIRRCHRAGDCPLYETVIMGRLAPFFLLCLTWMLRFWFRWILRLWLLPLVWIRIWIHRLLRLIWLFHSYLLVFYMESVKIELRYDPEYISPPLPSLYWFYKKIKVFSLYLEYTSYNYLIINLFLRGYKILQKSRYAFFSILDKKKCLECVRYL